MKTNPIKTGYLVNCLLLRLYFNQNQMRLHILVITLNIEFLEKPPGVDRAAPCGQTGQTCGG